MAPRRDPLSELKRVYAETTELTDALGKMSDSATSRSSEALFGAFVAAIGLAGAFAVSVALPLAAFYITGPIAVTLGLPLGMLVWRGPARIREERRILANRILYKEVMDRIHQLDSKAPDWVREGLWREVNYISANLGVGSRSTTIIEGEVVANPQLTHMPQIEIPSLSKPEEITVTSSTKPRRTRQRTEKRSENDGNNN